MRPKNEEVLGLPFLAIGFILCLLTMHPARAAAVAPPADVDLGLFMEEQQGGGGLMGGRGRLLNGNLIYTREDLRFPSPHSLGLAFQTPIMPQAETFSPSQGRSLAR